MIFEVLLGMGVGLALGLTGSGGILAVPALALGLHMSIPEAMPIALIAIGVAAFIGAIDGLRKKTVRYKAALLMAIAGVMLAPLGIKLALLFPAAVLVGIFSALLVFISLRIMIQMLYRPSRADLQGFFEKNCVTNPATGKFRWSQRCFLTLGSIGGVSGLLTGMLGVGGGFFLVPAIRQYSDLNAKSTISTSLAVIALVSAGTVLQVLSAGAVIPQAGVWFIAAAIVGMFFARLLSSWLSDDFLQMSFAMLALVAAGLLLHGQFFSMPSDAL